MYSSFNNSVTRFFAPTAIMAPGKRAYEMKGGEIALIDCDTGLSVDTAKKYPDKDYELLYKTHSKGIENSLFRDQFNTELPIRSMRISCIDKADCDDQAGKPQETFLAYLGFDGLDKCKTIDLKCGETYTLEVHIRSQVVRNTFNKNLTQRIPFKTGCCEGCDDQAKSDLLLQNILDAVKNSPYYANNYFRLNGIKSCCPEEELFPKKPFQNWSLTLCDDGSNSALGAVQSFYPDYDITRIKRDNPNSTYEICCLAEGVTPEPFVQKNVKPLVCDECPTCPDDFTKVEAGDKYTACFYSPLLTDPADAYTVDYYADTMAAPETIEGLVEALAANVPGYLPETAKVLGTTCDDVTLQVCVAKDTDLKEHGIAGLTVNHIGVCPGSCEGEKETEWCPGDPNYRISRKKCITLKKEDCVEGEEITLEDDMSVELAAAAYGVSRSVALALTTSVKKGPVKQVARALPEPGDLTEQNVVIGSLEIVDQTDCLIKYTIEQCSQCLEDGCDWFGTDGAEFPNIPPKDGFTWEDCPCEGWTFDENGCPIPPEVEDKECCIGLRFEGALVDEENLNKCLYDINDHIERDPISLEVAIVAGPDTAERHYEECDRFELPWNVVRWGSYKRGRGGYAARQERLSREYDGWRYFNPRLENGGLMRERFGYEYDVSPDKCYNYIQLYHNSSHNEHHQHNSHIRERILIAIDAENPQLLSELKTYFNATLLSHGVCKLL